MIFILYVQVKPEIFFIFTLSIKSVQIFCYDHLGEILPATKHQREKYASFRLLKLAEPRQKAKSSNFKKKQKKNKLGWWNIPVSEKEGREGLPS